MLQKNSLQRPDRQLEKTLIALVYAVVAIALSLLMLFIYPQYSLYLIVLTLATTVLCISLAIRVLAASEKALTYGGFANEILSSRDTIRRIDNNKGEPVIENAPAKKFLKSENIIRFLKNALINERRNQLNFQRLELALKSLKKENVILSFSAAAFDDESEDAGTLAKTPGETWCQISVRPLYLKKSGIFEEEFSIEKIEKETYFLWTLENVTAAQNMERIFEEERKKLHNFIHYLPVGIYVASSSGVLEYVNETFALQLGELRENLTGKPLRGLVQDADILLNPKTPSFAGRAFFKANEENAELFVLQNNFKEGNDIKIRGITLKELPNDLQLLERINYAADEMDWLFKTSPSGIIFTGMDGIVSLANRKAAEIFETPSETLPFANINAFLTPPAIKLLEDIKKKYQENAHNNEINKIETRLKSDKIIRLFVAPRRRRHGKNNTLEGLVLYLIDTTEQKNLELKFAQAQKMQAMGQLAGGVAHDFNNLLTAMIGFCDLLLQRHGIGDPSFADLIQIKQNANRAAGLVRQLLAFSRKQPLKPKQIDVTENFIELSHLLKRILGEQITLEFNHGTDLGSIRVDPVQFSQVIINLAVNAKDAMNGKGSLKISTRTESLDEPYQFGADTIAPGDFVVISVTDTGCGIPPENLNRIFEPFFSTKQNVAGSGTGLGLAMVYGIVRQTEGFIKVDSVLGKGTTFSVHLPRFERPAEDNEVSAEENIAKHAPVLTTSKQNQASDISQNEIQNLPNHSATWNVNHQQAAAEQNTVLGTQNMTTAAAGQEVSASAGSASIAPSAARRTAAVPDKIIFGLNVSVLDHMREPSSNPQDIKILFVEDEDSVRAFAIRALKKKGFTVASCNCAENALDLLAAGEKFTLLITDMVMPGLNGAELAKAVKEKLPDIKIILASGYSEEIARRELAGSDDFEFIAKPYSLGDLTKKVFEVLNG